MVNKETADEKTLNEKIVAMREGGKILGNLLRDLKNYVKPGMTGTEIDAWVRKEITKRGAEVAYDMLDEDFPGAICISINDELVHGAPKDEPLEEGDKVSFDLDIYYKGYFSIWYKNNILKYLEYYHLNSKNHHMLHFYTFHYFQ